MKPLAFSLLLLPMVVGLFNAQNVEIPDTRFLYALIEKGVDTDEDSLIGNTEAEAISYLIISSLGISDITGIEAFVNLDLLYCNRNNLTSLDVSNNYSLVEMPTLGEVCVWEMPFPPVGVTVDTTGSPNVYFTADCSK